MSDNIIEIRNVGIKFVKKKSLLKAKQSNEFWALNDISFDIKKGEVLGIMGRNGAGKSTLLSLLARIIAPTKGSINFNTNSVSLLSLQAGFVPFLSGRKNIVLSGLLLGLSRAQIDEKMEEIIEFSELGEFIDEPVINYSSGMKTRLGFSTAIKINPDVILIDEVLGVGDAGFKTKSSRALKEKIHSTNITGVIVSHSENTLKDVCDRIIVIDKGVVVHDGDVDAGVESYNKCL